MKQPSRSVPQIPWLTEDGYLDLGKVPLDSTLRRSLASDIREFGSACRVLGVIQSSGRTEAGIYLVGLFHHFRGDLARLAEIVEQLPKDELSAELLMAELYRVKGSNSTRRYLDTVVKTLASYPQPSIQEELERLSRDRRLSVRMRAKLRGYLDRSRFGEDFWA